MALAYSTLGTGRPPADWRWIDLMGEGGTALATAYWMRIVLASRPAGRVTLLLALGLGGVSLGLWADCLDEVFSMKDAPRIDKWLESGLMPLGMLFLTMGLVGWRREQFQLSEHMHLRERLFREHRDFDRITQLAGIEYLREQLELERQQLPRSRTSLVMIEATGLQDLQYRLGHRDAVRALQAITHQILLNLRNDELLCRYSGDRFVLLLPRTARADAERVARHLEQMVAQTAFHDRQGHRVALQLRTACADAEGDAATVLTGLNRALEQGERGHRSSVHAN
jgi:diguanylate cyclase (GGDEF)-like protein